jgi:hypothetical protein
MALSLAVRRAALHLKRSFVVVLLVNGGQWRYLHHATVNRAASRDRGGEELKK